jgi:hypothetical protein
MSERDQKRRKAKRHKKKARKARRLEARRRRLQLLIAAIAILAIGGGWALFRYRSHDEPVPPPLEGLAALRAQEAAQLSRYDWVDPDNGVVQIPIARAMQLIARRGLPARHAGPAAVSPLSRPSEGGLGIQKKKKRRGGRR